MINSLIIVSLAYVAALFLVAFYAERLAAQGRGAWLRSPIIYTLSLSVYCTAWTFYGAVGSAARAGLEFLAIYLGPTLVLLGCMLKHPLTGLKSPCLIIHYYNQDRAIGVLRATRI